GGYPCRPRDVDRANADLTRAGKRGIPETEKPPGFLLQPGSRNVLIRRNKRNQRRVRPAPEKEELLTPAAGCRVAWVRCGRRRAILRVAVGHPWDRRRPAGTGRSHGDPGGAGSLR